MSRILVLNENHLEREITQGILSAGLPTVEVLAASQPAQVIDRLRDGSIDLFIADVPMFDLTRCNMISAARRVAPDTPILITSVGKRMDVAAYVWRMGGQDYLLKPCRSSWRRLRPSCGGPRRRLTTGSFSGGSAT